MGKPSFGFDELQRYLSGELDDWQIEILEQELSSNWELKEELDWLKTIRQQIELSKKELEGGEFHAKHVAFIQEYAKNPENLLKAFDMEVDRLSNEIDSAERDNRSRLRAHAKRSTSELTDILRKVSDQLFAVEEQPSYLRERSRDVVDQLRNLRERLITMIRDADNLIPGAGGIKMMSVSKETFKDSLMPNMRTSMDAMMSYSMKDPTFTGDLNKFLERWIEVAKFEEMGAARMRSKAYDMFISAIQNQDVKALELLSDMYNSALATLWLAENESNKEKANEMFAKGFRQHLAMMRKMGY